jgi:hypothetical protein
MVWIRGAWWPHRGSLDPRTIRIFLFGYGGWVFIRGALWEVVMLNRRVAMSATGNWGVQYGTFQTLPTRDMLAAARPATVDVFSSHHYGGSSIRCATSGMQTTQDDALSESWLRRTDETLAFYKPLRDEVAPGAPFWLTETADVACGGNPWDAAFLDTFRYLDQLGRLAKQSRGGRAELPVCTTGGGAHHAASGIRQEVRAGEGPP